MSVLVGGLRVPCPVVLLVSSSSAIPPHVVVRTESATTCTGARAEAVGP